ncbi:hypothetical protein BN903_205 [Halorubrum sp. AJ67]|nr:hypothetical protein BN903_205 [Halorubrum sp. AJ67]
MAAGRDRSGQLGVPRWRAPPSALLRARGASREGVGRRSEATAADEAGEV